MDDFSYSNRKVREMIQNIHIRADGQILIFKEGTEPIQRRIAEEIKDATDRLFLWAEEQKSDLEIIKEKKEEAITIINEKTSDEEKIGLIHLYPTWESLIGRTLEADEYFQHEGILYRVIKPNTTIWEHFLPQDTPSEYEDMTKKILKEDGSYPDWVQPLGAHDAYKIGDIVTHNGKIWRCYQGDASGRNSWEPGVYGWEIYEEGESV